MQKQTDIIFATQFEEEVYQGLTHFPKYLSSKYFYDKKGDQLFQDIMNMPEYYLTNCEYKILETHKNEISDYFSAQNKAFHLIEMGAGDGKKTKILLKHLSNLGVDFIYQPIDISQNALDELEKSIRKELPSVNIETKQGTYFDTLDKLNKSDDYKKVILFLGSNIGNMLHTQAIDFLCNVQECMHPDDLLFIGFDLKKNPQTILNAYNDPAGITEAFNKNILTRINKELAADFDLNKFLHWEVYDPETGTAKSYLVSKEEQSVIIRGLQLKIPIKQWETIHTEISQKYDCKSIQLLAEKSGLKVEKSFSDHNNNYANYIFKKESY